MPRASYAEGPRRYNNWNALPEVFILKRPWWCPASVGGNKDVPDYMKLFANDINMLVTAIKKTYGK